MSTNLNTLKCTYHNLTANQQVCVEKDLNQTLILVRKLLMYQTFQIQDQS